MEAQERMNDWREKEKRTEYEFVKESCVDLSDQVVVGMNHLEQLELVVYQHGTLMFQLQIEWPLSARRLEDIQA